MRRWLVLLGFCLCPVALVAQTTIISTTSGLSFGASPDHNATFAGQPVLANYQAEFYTVTGTTCPAPTGTPLTSSLGKPTPDASNQITFRPIAPLLVPNTLYCAYVSAVGPGGVSARTTSVGPFGLPKVPAAPTAASLVP